MNSTNPINHGGLIHISMGGPEFDIQVNGRRYHFEMHPYCGPIRLNKKGNEHRSQPMEFLEAASFWAQQGQRVEDGLCRWDRTFEPEMITEHIAGRHHKFIGTKQRPPERGE